MRDNTPPLIYGALRQIPDMQPSQDRLYRKRAWSPARAASPVILLAQPFHFHFDVVGLEQFNQFVGFLSISARNMVNAAVPGVIFVA